MSPARRPSPASAIDFAGLGDRLRAYRVGAGLQAEQVAERLGVSRAALYRIEQGKIVKIETLQRLAQLLGTSLASLLGVEVEYHPTALGFLERLRQIEQSAERIVAHFEPISLLLASDEHMALLRSALLESAATEGRQAEPRRQAHAAEVDRIIALLDERRAAFAERRPNIVNLIGLREIERFLQGGLVGSLDLPAAARRQRVLAARREVERVADLMEQSPIHVQIAIVTDAMPSTSFELLAGNGRTVLAVSPFRLGVMPSLRNGVATVTAAPEPVALHEKMVDELWRQALKGKAGAAQLRRLIRRPQ